MCTQIYTPRLPQQPNSGLLSMHSLFYPKTLAQNFYTETLEIAKNYELKLIKKRKKRYGRQWLASLGVSRGLWSCANFWGSLFQSLIKNNYRKLPFFGSYVAVKLVTFLSQIHANTSLRFIEKSSIHFQLHCSVRCCLARERHKKCVKYIYLKWPISS